jgi:adenosylcobinamide-phosphate synthase
LPLSERAFVLTCALALDLAGGEPPDRWHPVAWLGHAIARLERAAPAGGPAVKLAYGFALAKTVVGGTALIGLTLHRVATVCPCPVRLFVLAAALKMTFSLRSLASTAERVAWQLEHERYDDARSSLRALVSRPTGPLDVSHSASAAIESVAENLSDSLIAPLLYYSLFGLPGAMMYRAANTVDAMIGYHGYYEQLGKAAAQLDDLLNVLPARLSGLLLVVAAWLGGGDGRAAWITLGRDHARTESPNAGWPMSAAAGALRVRLEKMGHYKLGESFASPNPRDVVRAVRLYHAAAALGIVLTLGTVCFFSRRARVGCGKPALLVGGLGERANSLSLGERSLP